MAVRAQRLEQIAIDAKQYLADCRLLREPEINPEGTPPEENDDPIREFIDKLAQVENRLLALKSVRLPRFCRSGGFLWLFVGAWILLAAPCGYFTDWHTSWLVISASGAVVVGAAASIWVYLQARKQVKQLFDPLCQDLVDAELARSAGNASLGQDAARPDREQAEVRQRSKRAADDYQKVKDEAGGERDRHTPARLSRNIRPGWPSCAARFDQALRHARCRSPQADDRAASATGGPSGPGRRSPPPGGRRS